MSIRRHIILQSLLLLAGAFVAWFSVGQDFMRFYGYEQTLFKIQDCVVTNPVLTPCFWGALAFVGGFAVALWIMRSEVGAQTLLQKRMHWFLVASTIFAWSNFSGELWRFYTAPAGTPVLGCSGGLISNPFLTACFFGSALFLMALANSFFLRSKQ